MVFQVAHAVFAHEPAVDDDHALNTGMVDEFRTHHAGLARDDKPSVVGRHTVGRSVADEVHFGVMAADFDPSARRDVHGVAKAFLATAQPSTSSRSTVVTVHQHHVALGVNQQGAEGPAGAVGGLSEGKALLNADGQVLVLHGLTKSLGRVPAFQSFATMAKASSSSAPSA